MTSHYQKRIATLAPGHNARHIEAWMRSEHTTLDHLTPNGFKAAVRDALDSIAAGGAELSESLAKSYGL